MQFGSWDDGDILTTFPVEWSEEVYAKRVAELQRVVSYFFWIDVHDTEIGQFFIVFTNEESYGVCVAYLNIPPSASRCVEWSGES